MNAHCHIVHYSGDYSIISQIFVLKLCQAYIRAGIVAALRCIFLHRERLLLDQL